MSFKIFRDNENHYKENSSINLFDELEFFKKWCLLKPYKACILQCIVQNTGIPLGIAVDPQESSNIVLMKKCTQCFQICHL